MTNLIYVGMGGFTGAVSRYLISGFADRVTGESVLPYGTMTVNILGCLLIGFGWGLAENRGLFSPEARLFIFTGILGGFTTFSTFGYDSFLLARQGHLIATFSNLFLQITLGFASVWAGNCLSRIV